MKYFINGVDTIFTFDNVPQRIVSLVPSQTELLHDLGLETEIVGVTKFCVHPPHLLKQKKQVGGTKIVKTEKIIALNPDIIICNKEENTLEMVRNLSHICPVLVTEIITFDDTLYMIDYFGHLFAKQNNAKEWTDKITRSLRIFKTFVETLPTRKVAYFIWKNPYMVAGAGTFINEMLQLNRFENIYSNETRYPEISLEDLAKNSSLDYIFLSSEPYPFNDNNVKELEKLIPNIKIIIVDGELFSWYGSRILQSFNYFEKLHIKILSQ